MTRRRWVYTSGGEPLPEPIEVTADYTGAERRAPVATEGIVHGGVVAPDGTDLSTRKRRREYMRQHEVADHSDYTQSFERARDERVKALTPGAGYDSATRREQLGRVAYELESKRGRKR